MPSYNNVLFSASLALLMGCSHEEVGSGESFVAVPVPESSSAAHPGLEDGVHGIPECEKYVRIMNQCFLPKAGDKREAELAELKQRVYKWRNTPESGRREASAECQRLVRENARELTASGCIKPR